MYIVSFLFYILYILYLWMFAKYVCVPLKAFGIVSSEKCNFYAYQIPGKKDDDDKTCVVKM